MSEHDDHLEVFKERFGLTYQVDFLRLIDQVCPLAGKKVLEIGGSNLPRELLFDGVKASQWICVDDVTTYHEHDVREVNPLLKDHYSATRTFRHSDDAAAILAEDHAIIDGDAADLNLTDHFDVVISIAAFEHVHKFAPMLDRIYDSLNVGGQLLSLFQPIWSCVNGHHIVGISDAAGNKIDFTSNLMPHWGHLLYTPPQMYKYLCERTDAKCAADIVYEVYNSTQVNRLFFEDYVDYVENSKFRAKVVTPLGQREVPEATAQALRAAHPGRTCFDANTVFIHAIK
ncbi:class I SAM-dependent methyltransferase [Phenylobacterium sp. LjRoot219]|uniref:class I SAM-dependent methyltransferase n=1 Tax=Phenylobacterium sp. LjRoot219 TaxID=3342283 RepID=UPI003ECCDDF1